MNAYGSPRTPARSASPEMVASQAAKTSGSKASQLRPCWGRMKWTNRGRGPVRGIGSAVPARTPPSTNPSRWGGGDLSAEFPSLLVVQSHPLVGCRCRGAGRWWPWRKTRDPAGQILGGAPGGTESGPGAVSGPRAPPPVRGPACRPGLLDEVGVERLPVGAGYPDQLSNGGQLRPDVGGVGR